MLYLQSLNTANTRLKIDEHLVCGHCDQAVFAARIDQGAGDKEEGLWRFRSWPSQAEGRPNR